MKQKQQSSYQISRNVLGFFIMLGLIACIPMLSHRMKTERSSRIVGISVGYQGLIHMANCHPNPMAYMSEQLDQLKAAGVTTMLCNETTLEDLKSLGLVQVYASEEWTDVQGKRPPVGQRHAYVRFASSGHKRAYEPLIRSVFAQHRMEVTTWKKGDEEGLVIHASPEVATATPIGMDPLAMQMLRSKGFHVLPRFGGEETIAYDDQQMKRRIAQLRSFDIKHVMFFGESVPGYAEKKVANFAHILNEHGIGIVQLSGAKKGQAGFNDLAARIQYNVIRLFSLSAEQMLKLSTQEISEWLVLAAKERNIRLLNLNIPMAIDSTKGGLVDRTDKVLQSLTEPGHIVEQLKQHGFGLGQPEPFVQEDFPLRLLWKSFVLLGSLAWIVWTSSYFVNWNVAMLSALVLCGCVAVYAMNPGWLMPVVSLLVLTSGPTLAIIMTVSGIPTRGQETSFFSRWWTAIVSYSRMSVLSLLSVPLAICLLHGVSYSLVLDQFRGVKFVHSFPILLVAIYIIFYGRGQRVWAQFWAFLKRPVTYVGFLTIVFGLGVFCYYLIRTGNTNSVSDFETSFRTGLEKLLSVRPRTKEFLIGHPLLLLGLFAAVRYPRARLLMIPGTIGQLSMVETFAHLHTPLMASFIRGGIGLSLGLIIGTVCIVVFYVGERYWNRWISAR